MEYGYRIIDDLKDGMALYLAEHGFGSVKDMKKTTLEGVISTEKLDRELIIYPTFLRGKCVGCHLCVLVCSNDALVSSVVPVSRKV